MLAQQLLCWQAGEIHQTGLGHAASKLSHLQAIDALEQRVRLALPIARVMYVEPDLYDSARAAAPDA